MATQPKPPAERPPEADTPSDRATSVAFLAFMALLAAGWEILSI